VGDTFINATTPLRPSDATPALLVDFDYARFAHTYSRIIAIANEVCFAQKQGREEKYGTIAWNCKNYMDMIVGQIAAQTQFPANALNCRQLYARIAVDLAGNVYPCHNRGGALGHISDGAQVLREKFLAKGNTPYKHQECRDCEALPLCGGQCPCVEPSPLKEKVCKLLREIIFNNDILLRYAGAQEFYNALLKECVAK
jgi:radical SAM protein with 4Fe4S-binding SPASM domain